MDAPNFLFWIAVEESKPVKFADLAHMMALAIHPAGGMAYGAAVVNLEHDLVAAVGGGLLIVRNSADMGIHTFPYGDALNKAVMFPWELRSFLESRGFELRLIPHGSGESPRLL